MPDLSSPMRNHQPTMNEDETIFIVTTSAKDLWEANELRLINFDNIVIVDECKCEEQEEEIPGLLELKLPDSAFTLLSGLEFSCDPIEFCEGAFIYITPDLLLETMPVIKVYPNPFINNILVNLDKTNLNYSFDLYDISGRKVLTTKLNNVSNIVRFNQPGSGIYIYKLTDKSGKLVTSGKLVKK
jgi:hypothetical protein